MPRSYIFGPRDLPLLHKFKFSSHCEFQGYHIKRQSSLFDENERGFFLSANSNCEFDTPIPKEVNVLTAHYSDNLGDFKILEYPNYYRDLCSLAEKTRH